MAPAARAGIRASGPHVRLRFAAWPPGLARLSLVALVLALVAAALVPIHGARRIHTPTVVERLQAVRHGALGKTTAPPRKRDADLALYDRVIAHLQKGERYYDFIVAEQRRSRYPVRPGLTVRLPTLAWIEAASPPWATLIAAVALTMGTILAWWRRLGDELADDLDDAPGDGQAGTSGPHRLRWAAIVLLAFGALPALNRYYFVLHELWSGMLLALAFGLHRAPATDAAGARRPGRWAGAWFAAALALAIREHALPFVALMLAFAAARRQWREAAAWAALIAGFLVLIAWHVHLVDAHVLAGDRVSAPWLAWRGLSGWLSNIVLASNLHYGNRNVGGVVVVLALFGWAAWRAPAGLFGVWLFAGYGVLFMIAGRWDNFYWGAEVAPALFVGLAFVPAGAAALVQAAAPRLAWRRGVLQTGRR